MVESWKELWKSAGFTLGILRSNTPVITSRRERVGLFYLISEQTKKKMEEEKKKNRGSLDSKSGVKTTLALLNRLSGRRALVKTAASPAAKTWLNPKSRSYALQGGSGSIGQGAHRHSYTQVTPPAFL